VKTIDEAEQLIAEGKGFKILCVDIHREFYGLDDEALCMKMHGYDLRTEKYLKAVKENIGFIEEKHGWDDEKINNPQTISIWANASDVEIGQTEDGAFVPLLMIIASQGFILTASLPEMTY
jgi:hypothetical protein